MSNFENYIILSTATIKFGLEKLNALPVSLTLFVVNDNKKIVGTLTDGDIRRALLKGINITEPVSKIMCVNFFSLIEKKFTIEQLKTIREKEISLIPFVDENNFITRIVDLEHKKSVLPVDAVIMAGGEGKRLRPLTNNVPKPMLKIGNKPIIEYNVSRLADFGIENVYIAINYLGQQIVDYFSTIKNNEINIHYLNEKEPLGTIGAVSLIPSFPNDVILLMNSDLLTNIDLEDFYLSFISSGASMAVATIPYVVNIPYAVVETSNGFITHLKEKPAYTYYSNAGIYLFKREVLSAIPKGQYYNATDLMDQLIIMEKKILSYPILGYWLDIGQHADFEKAKQDINHIKF